MQNNSPCSRFLVIIIAVLAGGCAPGVSGFVRDAATERPVGGAIVELRDSGWGFRQNQLVWDAEKILRVTTDGIGRFEFKADQGQSLRVFAPHRPDVNASLCARSPMIVRIGGPFAGLTPDRRVIFEQERSFVSKRGLTSPYLAMVGDVELRASGGAFADEDDLRIESYGGVRFVEGTGTIPRPPAMPYDHSVELDLRSNCGWLFVSNGTAVFAVIWVGPLGLEEDRGSPRKWVLLYSALPGQ